MGKLKRDRASNAPGGMECCACGSIFIGDESHDLCAVCQNATTLNLAEIQEALAASEHRVKVLAEALDEEIGKHLDTTAKLIGAETRLDAAEKALRHYTKDKWAPVADYSLNYWYQKGRAPWKHAEKALSPTPAQPADRVKPVAGEERT